MIVKLFLKIEEAVNGNLMLINYNYKLNIYTKEPNLLNFSLNDKI